MRFHCFQHYVALAPEAISHNIGFLSNVPVAKSNIDSLAQMLLLCISYNTNEDAFAITYKPRAPLPTGPITNQERRTLVIMGADDAEDEDEDEEPI